MTVGGYPWLADKARVFRSASLVPLSWDFAREPNRHVLRCVISQKDSWGFIRPVAAR